jgi:hypothetical protein
MKCPYLGSWSFLETSTVCESQAAPYEPLLFADLVLTHLGKEEWVENFMIPAMQPSNHDLSGLDSWSTCTTR